MLMVDRNSAIPAETNQPYVSPWDRGRLWRTVTIQFVYVEWVSVYVVCDYSAAWHMLSTIASLQSRCTDHRHRRTYRKSPTDLLSWSIRYFRQLIPHCVLRRIALARLNETLSPAWLTVILNSGWFNAFSTVPKPTVFTTFRSWDTVPGLDVEQNGFFRYEVALVRHRRMKPVTQWRCWYYCIRACYRLGQKDAVDIYSVASVVWTGIGRVSK
jgi:hypothetical protein